MLVTIYSTTVVVQSTVHLAHGMFQVIKDILLVILNACAVRWQLATMHACMTSYLTPLIQ